MKKKLWAGLAVGVMVLGMAGVASATIIFSDNFESDVSPQWSTSNTYKTPNGLAPFGNTTGLGRFGNETVSLSLSGLSSHSEATISFELFLHDSWDGNAPGWGPDNFRLNIQGGTTLLSTTFSNVTLSGFPQAYPNGGSNSPGTGSASSQFWYEHGPNGYYGNSVYLLSFTFDHTGSSLGFDFSGSGLQEIADESWGLDNVVVSSNAAPVPEPATMLLMGTGLAGLIGARRKKK